MSDAHIVALPSFVFILRIVTIVLSIIVLGLAAFALDLTKSDLGISNSNSGSGSGSVNNVDLSGWGIGKREWRNYNPFLNGDNVAFFIFLLCVDMVGRGIRYFDAPLPSNCLQHVGSSCRRDSPLCFLALWIRCPWGYCFRYV